LSVYTCPTSNHEQQGKRKKKELGQKQVHTLLLLDSSMILLSFQLYKAGSAFTIKKRGGGGKKSPDAGS
jgi:hypothetical protein